jgi:outer membrane lipoprotein SlyB
MPSFAALLAAVILLVMSSSAYAAPADPRSDAIDRILPGQSVRIQATSGAVEGAFVTNRSDSLLLRHQAERMSFSYSDIQRVEVRRPATSRGMVIGMIVGGLALGGVAVAEGSAGPAFVAAAGVFFGGFLGGSIGSAFSRWDHVYETVPAHADSTPPSPHH